MFKVDNKDTKMTPMGNGKQMEAGCLWVHPSPVNAVTNFTFQFVQSFYRKKIEIFAKGIQIFVEALRRDTKNIGTGFFWQLIEFSVSFFST